VTFPLFTVKKSQTSLARYIPVYPGGRRFSTGLERFKKYCSHSGGQAEEAVFLGFGFVSAQSQAAAGMLLRQSLAKTQKSSLRMATLFLKTL
jgi:hypothetical protein